MVAEENITPEKQLLNLIENPPSQGAVRGAALKRAPAGVLSGKALKGRFAFFRKHLNRPKHPFQISIRTVNRGLIAMFCVLIVYFGVSTFFSFSDLKRRLNKWEDSVPVDPSSAHQAFSSLKDLKVYTEKIQERDIFQIGPRRKVTKAQEVTGPSNDFVKATKDLRLVGISWSDNPDIMIEDANRKMTFFLKKGQELEGGVLVKDVFKDRVILEYKGEEIELQ